MGAHSLFICFVLLSLFCAFLLPPFAHQLPGLGWMVSPSAAVCFSSFSPFVISFLSPCDYISSLSLFSFYFTRSMFFFIFPYYLSSASFYLSLNLISSASLSLPFSLCLLPPLLSLSLSFSVFFPFLSQCLSISLSFSLFPFSLSVSLA